MGTPMMWFAFGKSFVIYDNLISFPFRWNSSRRQMSFVHDRALKNWLYTGTMILTHISSVINVWYMFSCESYWTTLNYIQVLVSLFLILFCIIMISFAVHFSLHGEEMAALFTDSHRALTGAVDILKINYVLAPKPIHHDFLGIIFTLGIALGPMTAICILPGICAYLKLDPFYLLFRDIPPSSIFVPITICARFLFLTVEVAVLVRWYSFSLMQLFLVLTIGNTGFKLLYQIVRYPQNFRHLPQKPEKVLFIEDAVQLTVWHDFLINLIVIQRRIFLHTKFWSYNIGFIIFILITVGVILWACANYALVLMNPILPIELTIFLFVTFFVCCFLYFTMVTYVTSIEGRSDQLNQAFTDALKTHKLGRRYVHTLVAAKISTPYFSFRKVAQIALFKIPFDITVNLVLTFPLEF